MSSLKSNKILDFVDESDLTEEHRDSVTELSSTNTINLSAELSGDINLRF